MAFSDLQAEAIVAVLEELGADVTYQPAAGDPVTVRGIFFNGYQPVQLEEVEIQSSMPVLVVLATEVTNPAQGETFVIEGETWRIYNPQPDRKGLVVIELEENPVA